MLPFTSEQMDKLQQLVDIADSLNNDSDFQLRLIDYSYVQFVLRLINDNFKSNMNSYRKDI